MKQLAGWFFTIQFVTAAVLGLGAVIDAIEIQWRSTLVGYFGLLGLFSVSGPRWVMPSALGVVTLGLFVGFVVGSVALATLMGANVLAVLAHPVSLRLMGSGRTAAG